MLTEDRYVLETPENIEVEFEPAGLGSRFCAMLLDTIWIGLLILALFLLLLLVGFGAIITGADGGRWAGWVAAVVLAVITVLMFEGYFIFFEWLMRGQTPGKRSMKIRVVRDDGTPVGTHEVLIRNLLRVVDFLPAGYALGALVMFPNPLAKRLGDIAAGTIVVKEGQRNYRAQADKKYDLPPATLGPVNSELLPEERRLLVGFLQRRFELLPNARQQLAERLAKPLFEKYGGQFGYAEGYIERLVKGRHYESLDAWLSAEERRGLVQFLQRRSEYLPEVRREVAERLAKPLHERFGGQLRDPERFIERLVEGRHDEP